MGNSKSKQATKFSKPSDQDLFLAAYTFDQVARSSDIQYAIVGGFSARIYGASRLTESLDILIAVDTCSNKTQVNPVIDELFDKNPLILGYTGPNRQGHIVIINKNVAVPINFINCGDPVYEFPDLVAETRSDGTLRDCNEPEPTWSLQDIQPSGKFAGFCVPVLLPRLLLEQRVKHFIRPHEQDEVNRQKNDIEDITAYLTVLFGSEHQSFTGEEARYLLPHVRNIMRFAESHSLQVPELAKWRWINIPIREGDWRKSVSEEL